MAVKHNKPHEVNKYPHGPKLGGPYLDDIRAEQARAKSEAKMKANRAAIKKVASAPVAKKTTAKKASKKAK